MLSNSSLQAFSSATTQATGGVGATNAIRLVRAQPDAAARQVSPNTVAIPDSKPGLPPPRGSLLNLSV